jgi:thioesterase domain-containing protein
VVAFELGHQLRRAGEDVTTLILIEPPPLGAWQGSDGRRQRLGPALRPRAWHQAGGYLARVRAAAVEGRLVSAGLRILRRSGQAGRRRRAAPGRHRLRGGGVALRRARWPGLVTCVRTRASAVAGAFDPGTWRRVVDDLRVEVVPGDHESCLVAEAAALAERLRAAVTG